VVREFDAKIDFSSPWGRLEKMAVESVWGARFNGKGVRLGCRDVVVGPK
jgi:hypothetical protein